jgi:hypothetical protein
MTCHAAPVRGSTRLLMIPVALALLMIAACSNEENPANVPESTEWTQPDPAPEQTGDRVTVGHAGGRWDLEGVTVHVPRGASSEQVEVAKGKEIGRYGDEWFGRPVHIDHQGHLAKSVTVSWPVGDLTQEQARSAMLVHYNEDLEVWEATRGELRMKGGRLVARVRDFSWIDWVANVGQVTGQLTGSRVDAPTCSSDPLPDWVDQVVDPDEDLAAAAIRVCFERDRDDQVTVRVADNRTFTQRLVMREGGQEWAWTWPGDQGAGISATVVGTAHQVFDSPTTYLVPALQETAVGIARPNQPGSHFIRVEATVDAVTVLVDLVNWAANNLSPGGLENPLADAFLQALYECGGKELLDGVPPKAAGIVRAVVESIGSCAEEIVEWDSEFGARFEALVQEQIRRNPGESAENWAKANRLVREVAHAFKILEVGKVAFYLSDQFANSLVGNLSFSIRGDGTPQELGEWTPTCDDIDADSNRIYRNLALRDEFSDTSSDLWQFPQWEEQVQQAVEPLTACDPLYLAQLAAFLPGDWGDPRAAAVVANAITQLTGGANTTAISLIDPFTATGLKPGWRLGRSYQGGYYVDCAYDHASPNAVGPSTHWCGGTADAANACWSGQFSTAELWCLNTFDMDDRTLRVIDATNVNDDTPSPEEPDPLFLQLKDGSRWFYRIGGAWGGRADGLNPVYGCINDVGVCGTRPNGTDGYLILIGDGVPMIDMSHDTWRVRIGLFGDPRHEFPPPTWVEVSRAWFIAGHRWYGD